eukprot:SAG11_NODE_2628_length_3159_cov_6.484967_2_plen_67_part_00
MAYGMVCGASKSEAERKDACMKGTALWLLCAPFFWPCMGCYARQKLAYALGVELYIPEDLLCHVFW